MTSNSTSSAGPVILTGIDGGSGSAPVLRAAARLAEMAGGHLVIAHVVATPPLGAQGYVGLPEGSLDEVEADLFPDIVEALVDARATWSLVTVAGNPAAELIRLAEANRASAIVVGADTPGWTSHLRRLPTGSVPSRLAHEQRAPVVIVPEACSRGRSHDAGVGSAQ